MQVSSAEPVLFVETNHIYCLLGLERCPAAVFTILYYCQMHRFYSEKRVDKRRHAKMRSGRLEKVSYHTLQMSMQFHMFVALHWFVYVSFPVLVAVVASACTVTSDDEH